MWPGDRPAVKLLWDVWLVMWREKSDWSVQTLAAGDHWPDFDLIAVVEHFVFGDEIVAFDDEMCFDDEIQLAQEVFDFLGTFDFDGSGWMAELDVHGRMIVFHAGRGKGGRKAKRVRLRCPFLLTETYPRLNATSTEVCGTSGTGRSKLT